MASAAFRPTRNARRRERFPAPRARPRPAEGSYNKRHAPPVPPRARRHYRRALLLLLASHAPTRAHTTAAPAQPGAITGRVTTDDGKPIREGRRRAECPRVPAEHQRPVARAESDADGPLPHERRTPRPLPPAHAHARAHLARSARLLLRTGKLINGRRGRDGRGRDFVLTRGAASSTGRVTAGDGKPAIGERTNVTYADPARRGRPAALGRQTRSSGRRTTGRLPRLRPPARPLPRQRRAGHQQAWSSSRGLARYARTFHHRRPTRAGARRRVSRAARRRAGTSRWPKRRELSGPRAGSLTRRASPSRASAWRTARCGPIRGQSGGWGWDGSKSTSPASS